MTVQAAIEARAVSCRTRTGEVTVRDVSLTVEPGELVAIIGSSGSGKTALLDALCGLRPPASGTVLRHPDRQIGYVPAGDSLPRALPLTTALRYTAALRGRRNPGEAVAEALAAADLTAEASVPVGVLNPGARKRAETAAELLAAPAALFLADPTASLDSAQATVVLRLLRRLSEAGTTVLLTTRSPLDAARSTKVAVLASGGHLAFFGTPAAARGYFGADSMEEIYERMAGLGDPAGAWLRRFFYFSRTTSGSAPVPTTPRSPGPALLIPDQAGPHSAGRPSLPFAADIEPGDWTAPARESDNERDHAPEGNGALPPGSRNGTSPNGALRTAAGTSRPGPRQRPRPTRRLSPARQLPVLIHRNADILARDRRQQARLAAAPLAVLLLLAVLLVTGALNGPAAVTLAWAVLGALVTGLAYELPARAADAGILRREHATGVSRAAYLAAKAAVLFPVAALADLVILALPAAANRLQAGFAPSYLAVLLASLTGLAVAALVRRPGGSPASSSRAG